MELRCETAADAGFVRQLFDEARAARLAPAGLSPEALARLLDLQHRGQSISYGVQFPMARHLMAWRGDVRVGRLIEAEQKDAFHIVDIAVAQAFRRQGLARAMLAATIARARRSGASVIAEVDWDNAASLAMFANLGFEMSGGPQDLQAHFILSADIA